MRLRVSPIPEMGVSRPSRYQMWRGRVSAGGGMGKRSRSRRSLAVSDGTAAPLATGKLRPGVPGPVLAHATRPARAMEYACFSHQRSTGFSYQQRMGAGRDSREGGCEKGFSHQRPRKCSHQQGPRRRRGTVLIVTMILVFALASVTLVLCRSMRVEVIASANYAATLQASAVERGAEAYLTAILTEDAQDLNNFTEDYFAGIQIGDGYFWVLRPDYGDNTLPLFGLVDESSKLNINTATYDQLMILPCMTDDVAAAIVDWRDTDSDVSSGGAEDETYLSLPDPYYTKNAPFESVEELFLVRGVTPDLLYGTGDAPPLGSASLFSTLGSSTGSSMLEDVWLQRGIFDLLTIWGAESAQAADGTQRVNISNTQDRSQLWDMLRNQLGQQRGDQIASAVGNGALIDVFDLYFKGKMTQTELAQIADYISSSSPSAAAGGAGGGQSGAAGGQSGASGGAAAAPATTSQASGKINVNWAPREVLLTLEHLDTSDVDKLISARSGLNLTDLDSIAWVADALGEKAVGLGNLITARSSQFSALILAVSGNGRGFKLVRVVIDVGSGTPQIIYRRDLTERGWPMDPSILDSLKAGQGPGALAGDFGSSLGGALR